MNLSIILPVFNGEKEIAKTVKKILDSSYKDFELIIINDSSKDNSVKEIKKFDDKRIKLIENKKNLGITKSLIEGIKKSEGKYIARIDCGDYVDKNRFEEQINYLEKGGFVCVSSYVKIVDEKGKKLLIQKPKENNFTRLTYGNIFTHSSLLFTKKAYDKVGGYEAKFYYAQEYDLLLKFSELGEIGVVPKVLLTYTYGGGISNSKRKKQELSVIKIKLEMLKRRKNLHSLLSLGFGVISWVLPSKLKKLVTRI